MADVGVADRAPLLCVDGAARSFSVKGREVAALGPIDLTIDQGDFVSIVGYSGCGKSTLLRLIAGLDVCTRGRVMFHGEPVVEPTFRCGLMFQEPRLMPWLSVRKNIAFGIGDLPKNKRRERVEECLAIARLEDFADAWPAQLSGGMAQRVAIARALAPAPELLLLDEPFGALDAFTRTQLQDELLRIWQLGRTTMVLVTHDIEEAVYLGQRVIVLTRRPGTICASVDTRNAGFDRNSALFAEKKSDVVNWLLNRSESGERNQE